MKWTKQPCLQVLLTTTAERTSYKAELEGDVVMGCRFFPLSQHPYEDLTVSWHWISPARSREVYRMDRGQEQASFRHPDFQGRARLLTEQIKDGWAKLQVTRLRINDTGTYQCIIGTTNGAHYKDIKLSVTAPFKTVTKNIFKTAKEGELVLTCQSEGYPKSTVTWEDNHQRELNASTTVVLTEDRLFRITTQIRVASSQKNNYTCSFNSSGSSTSFLIPEDTQLQKGNQHKVDVISAAVGAIIRIALIGFIIVLIYLHQKGFGKNMFAVIRDMFPSSSPTVPKLLDWNPERPHLEEEATKLHEGELGAARQQRPQQAPQQQEPSRQYYCDEDWSECPMSLEPGDGGKTEPLNPAKGRQPPE
ncbi:programmed cell death 1 ligand 1-like [Phycodurus eques]|uniref:programmed cell death 1 ligand 1-like n=1 Tax=Phycodurus eques TaxID=693459 RepID=UPI002ACE0B1E|nr:programmed cell death 1 ligand 1-like [Phycodurus eques]